MHLEVIILDARPSYLPKTCSILALPVGAGTLLEELCGQEALQRTSPPTIICQDYTPTDAHRAHFAAQGIHHVIQSDHAGLARRLRRLDPSDKVLIIDVRRIPFAGLDLAELSADKCERAEARHLIGFPQSDGGVSEEPELDETGALIRVRRLFAGLTERRARAIYASLAPAPEALYTLDECHQLAPERARRECVALGLLSTDIDVEGGILDLMTEAGALMLLERAEEHRRRAGKHGRNGKQNGHGRRTENGVQMIGDVTIQPDVRISPGAVIIGPTILGAGSRIGANAVVAQCVVLPGTLVPEGLSVRHCVAHDDRLAAKDDGYVLPANPIAHDVALTTRPFGFRVIPRKYYLAVRRGVEIAVSLLGLLLFAPLMLLIAALIKLTSPGPIFYGDQREGLDQKPFRCLKFRTMVANAHLKQRELKQDSAVDGPQFKMANDPRVTRIGKLLRRSNLDELPQLFNVLKGDMSLIGPRPSPFRENQQCVPWRRARLSVRPGITGLWQICRTNRSDGDFHQWIYYDVYYVRNVSFWLDMKILLATMVTLGGRRAVPFSRLVGEKRRAASAIRPAPAQSICANRVVEALTRSEGERPPGIALGPRWTPRIRVRDGLLSGAHQ